MFWLLTYYLLNIEKVGPNKEGEKNHLQLLHLQAAMGTWGGEVWFSHLFCSVSIHTCCMLNGFHLCHSDIPCPHLFIDNVSYGCA